MGKHLLTSLLLLCSCAHHSDWHVSKIKSGTSHFDSSRLSYHPRDRGIHFEILKTLEEEVGYLYVCSHKIRQGSVLSVKTSTKNLSFNPVLHEGGHKATLPQEALFAMIEALKDGEDIVLEISGYHTTIDPKEFLRQYKNMQSPHKFSNPFKLPF